MSVYINLRRTFTREHLPRNPYAIKQSQKSVFLCQSECLEQERQKKNAHGREHRDQGLETSALGYTGNVSSSKHVLL